MLPLQQAYEVKQSILEYLKTTFSFKGKIVSDAFFRFIVSPEDGIFKGSIPNTNQIWDITNSVFLSYIFTIFATDNNSIHE